MSWHVYPTETPIGLWEADDADRAREFQHAAWLNYVHQSPLASFCCYGGTITKGTGDTADIASGMYVIEGRMVQQDAADSVAIAAGDATNYIWAQLNKTGDLVTSVSYYSNTTGTVPDDSVMIGILVRASGVYTATQSAYYPRVVTGTTLPTDVFLGFEPKAVMVQPEDHPSFTSEDVTITSFGFTTTHPHLNPYIAFA